MEYGCIGKSLQHSFSAEIHERLSGIPYELIELDEGQLADFFHRREFRGVNVTIPYKEAVIPFLDELSPVAKAIGAVNTVCNRGGKLIGFNTDFPALASMINEKLNIRLSGKTVAVFGTGGTAKTAASVIKTFGGTPIFVSRHSKIATITYPEFEKKYSHVQGIVNATPFGMYPDLTEKTLADISTFDSLSFVADVVYRPLRSSLVLAAKEKNIPAIGGLFMLVRQAVLASELFLETTYPENTTEKIWTELFREKKNIVLIGMPSSGKTTVGKLLAKEAGRPFYDSDRLLQDQTGISASDFIRKFGEDAFRDAESEIIRQLSAQSGAIIATGGGSVLREKNITLLKQNGKIILLDRPLDLLLPSSDRPLSSTREELYRLWEKRSTLYQNAADVIIPNSHSPQETVQQIRSESF